MVQKILSYAADRSGLMAAGAYRVKALGLSQPSLFLKTSVFPGKRLQAARLCETSATTARSLTRYKKIKSFGVCPTSEDGAFLKNSYVCGVFFPSTIHAHWLLSKSRQEYNFIVGSISNHRDFY